MGITSPPVVVTAGADTYRGAGSVAPGTAALADDQLYHWDVGAGIQLGRFFIESKYISINTTGKSSAYVPIIVGLNF